MRLPVLAATAACSQASLLACTFLLAQMSLALAAEQQSSLLELSSAYHQPVLDGMTLAFAYNRMQGLTPDFRPYAKRSAAYTGATAFDRDTVLAREIARLQAQFQALDLHKVYDLNLRTELHQYDSAGGGYPLPLSEGSLIPVRDPATAKGYGVQSRNMGMSTLSPSAVRLRRVHSPTEPG